MRTHDAAIPPLDHHGARLHVGDAVRLTGHLSPDYRLLAVYVVRLFAAIECDNDDPHDCGCIAEVRDAAGQTLYLPTDQLHWTGHGVVKRTSKRARA